MREGGAPACKRTNVQRRPADKEQASYACRPGQERVMLVTILAESRGDIRLEIVEIQVIQQARAAGASGVPATARSEDAAQWEAHHKTRASLS